MQLDMADTIC